MIGEDHGDYFGQKKEEEDRKSISVKGESGLRKKERPAILRKGKVPSDEK